MKQQLKSLKQKLRWLSWKIRNLSSSVCSKTTELQEVWGKCSLTTFYILELWKLFAKYLVFLKVKTKQNQPTKKNPPPPPNKQGNWINWENNAQLYNDPAAQGLSCSKGVRLDPLCSSRTRLRSCGIWCSTCDKALIEKLVIICAIVEINA